MARAARRRRGAAALALITCAACGGPPSHSDDVAPHRVEGLGAVAFPNSGSPEAQDDFLRGVLLLHSFEYEDAAEAFRRAHRIDPDFVLAYWGEAMTHNHPLWREQSRGAALEALRRLGRTPAERAARARSDRERAWLGAVEVLYGEGDKEWRDDAYMSAMRDVHEAYPDDLEARAFYGLSILGTAHEGRDFRTYMRAAATVQPVLDANPEHPGALHYLIHAFDDPVHAPLGLSAARAYASVAPRAAHAQHMTSHIFVAMGMWDEVVRANEVARDVLDRRLEERGRPPEVCGHYTSWLEYGYLMQDRLDDAAGVLEACHARVVSGTADPGELNYFISMRARYVLDARDWDSAEGRWAADVGRSPWARVPYDFITAMARLRSGDASAARRLSPALERLSESADVRVEDRLLADQLEALLLADAGREDEAVALLRDVAAREADLPYAFGPPAVLAPSHELLGEVLLALSRNGEAVEAFDAALERAPGRRLTLEGRAMAAGG